MFGIPWTKARQPIELRSVTALFVVFTAWPSVRAQETFELVGFAVADGDGLRRTIGGEGGATAVASNFAELEELAASSGRLVIEVSGTISGSGMVRLESDKTLIGRGSDALLQGFGIHIGGKSNIIIRNLSFAGADDDAINVQDSSHHVWIDHCDLASAHDGLIDIKRGSSWITVSWNRFREHGKTCLLGHSDDNGAEDSGRLKVTYHHNWFERTRSRHPRVRFGECHVFNNFYDRVTDYGIASTENADVLVEANYFLGVDEPTLVGYAASGPGDLIEIENVFVGSGEPETAGTVFDPSTYYVYDPDPAVDVPAIVRAGAGVAGFTSAPTAVFVRGETNGDGWIDIADAVSILFHSLGSGVIDCEKAADTNDDGAVSVPDVVYILQFLFRNGPAPAAPFPACGLDPSGDEVPCLQSPGC